MPSRHIVLQPNVGSWGKSGSDCRTLEMTRLTDFVVKVAGEPGTARMSAIFRLAPVGAAA
jgi:hypothetical protein